MTFYEEHFKAQVGDALQGIGCLLVSAPFLWMFGKACAWVNAPSREEVQAYAQRIEDCESETAVLFLEGAWPITKVKAGDVLVSQNEDLELMVAFVSSEPVCTCGCLIKIWTVAWGGAEGTVNQHGQGVYGWTASGYTPLGWQDTVWKVPTPSDWERLLVEPPSDWERPLVELVYRERFQTTTQ